MTQYYTYIWFDPKTNDPIYVGKGHGNRAYYHFKSKYKIGNVLRKRLEEGYNLVPRIYPAVNEDAAIAMEIALITYIGRADTGQGPLFNLTDGGEGGINVSAESRKKMGKPGRKFSKEQLEKLKGRTPWNKDAIGQQVAWNKGLSGYSLHNEESKAAIGKAAKRKQTPEQIAKRVEACRKTKDSNPKTPISAETRAKLSAAQQKRRLREAINNEHRNKK